MENNKIKNLDKRLNYVSASVKVLEITVLRMICESQTPNYWTESYEREDW